VPVEPADHELLSRRDRRRGADALDGEPDEGVHQHRRAGDQHDGAEHAQRQPVRPLTGTVADLPAMLRRSITRMRDQAGERHLG